MTTRAALLRDEHDRARARVAALRDELEGVVEASSGMNLDDEHDAEGATVAFERQRIAALLDHATVVVAQLDAALERLEDGRYDSCASCGGPIGEERLAALVTATTCVTCAAGGPGRPRSWSVPA
jgi:DnaK suppressor protein